MTSNIPKCRICLLQCHTHTPLFEYVQEDDVKYCDLIEQYTGLEIEQSDNLPNVLCDECLSELKALISFVNKVKLSVEKLNLLSNCNDKSKPLENEVKYESNDCPVKYIVKDEVPIIKDEKFELDDYYSEDIFHLNDGDLDDSEDVSLMYIKTKKKKKSHKRLQSSRINQEGTNSNLKLKTHSRKKLKKKFLIKKVGTCITPDLLNSSIQDLEGSDINYSIVRRSTNKDLKKDMVKCLVCGLLTQNKSAFVTHFRKHTGERPFKCTQCDKTFKQGGTLSSHIKKNHSLVDIAKIRDFKKQFNSTYTCDSCSKVFNRKSSLVIHIRHHTKEKRFRCPYCPKEFIQSSSKIMHIRRHHTKEKPYICHVCSKSFVSSDGLRRHSISHSDERNYKCEMCDMALKSKNNLKNHILVMHATVKQHICEVCGTAFACNYFLEKHKKAKHSETSGECNICKKHFSNLEKHLKTHSIKKEFICEMCQKCFSRQTQLKVHMKRHYEENMTYNCPYEDCNLVLTNKSKMDFHVLKSHTKETPFICSHCSRGFYRRVDLRRHMVSTHFIQPDVPHKKVSRSYRPILYAPQ